MDTKAIKRHGGKWYLAKKIIEHSPKRYLHYCEPYFGGGAVLFERPFPCSEVVNDLDGNLMSFWRALQSDQLFSVLQRMLEATPFAEPVFEEAQAIIENSEYVSVEKRAWAFFVLARQSRQGLLKDFATLSRNRTRRGINEQASSWLSSIEGLPEIHARLRSVVLLCKPAVEVIKQQDGENTWFYVDPPYLHETRETTKDYGEFEMSEEDHVKLLDTLSQLKGKFSLSGYPSSLYTAYAETFGWRCEVFEIDNKASSKKIKDKKQECLWMNY